MATPLDLGFLEEWGERFLGAWNAQDPDAIVGMCTEQVTIDDPALPETLHGLDGMRRFAAGTFRAFPDLRIEALEPPYLSSSQPRALARWRMTGTMEGPWEFMDLAATGKSMEILGLDIWDFESELPHRQELLYDGLEMTRQLAGAADGARA